MPRILHKGPPLVSAGVLCYNARRKGKEAKPMGESGALALDSVRLSDDRSCLLILDQTLLPGRTEVLRLYSAGELWEAIRSLRVRGAPAIGVAAAFGAALAASKLDTEDPAAFLTGFLAIKDYLSTARPTAVNLFWALDRLERRVRDSLPSSVPEIKEALFAEAQAIRDGDVAISRAIGEFGYGLLGPGCGILTHCNAGTLATAKYGTALAPVYLALERGRRDLRVYCDETRPLLQGARLTAFEMQSAGVDTTLICDGMASFVMQSGKIDLVLVGCDRVAANGDAANKIGTSGVAILAKHYGIPFYVCAPSSTIDLHLASGAEIPIEERPPEEITEMWYRMRMAPAGVKVLNPAFDVTDHSLITGIITECGIARAPFRRAFGEMGIG